MLRGTATLRTTSGERASPAGPVAHFSPGPRDPHTVMNLGDEPMRYVMIAAHASPDIVEYPDKQEFAAGAKTVSQLGEPFFVRLPLQVTTTGAVGVIARGDAELTRSFHSERARTVLLRALCHRWWCLIGRERGRAKCLSDRGRR